MASARPSAPQTWNRYLYGLNNPLKYIDPSGLNADDIGTAEDQRRQQAEQQRQTTPPPPGGPVSPAPIKIDIGPAPLPEGVQPIPTSISLKVGDLQTYNGETIRYANGDPVLDSNDNPRSGYGFGRTVTITVLDQGGNPISPNGVTLTESVEITSAQPPEASQIGIGREDRPVPIQAGGVVEDVQGLISPSPLPTNLPPFTIQTRQTLTATTNGVSRVVGVNTITVTNAQEQYHHCHQST